MPPLRDRDLLFLLATTTSLGCSAGGKDDSATATATASASATAATSVGTTGDNTTGNSSMSDSGQSSTTSTTSTTTSASTTGASSATVTASSTTSTTNLTTGVGDTGFFPTTGGTGTVSMPNEAVIAACDALASKLIECYPTDYMNYTADQLAQGCAGELGQFDENCQNAYAAYLTCLSQLDCQAFMSETECSTEGQAVVAACPQGAVPVLRRFRSQ